MIDFPDNPENIPWDALTNQARTVKWEIQAGFTVITIQSSLRISGRSKRSGLRGRSNGKDGDIRVVFVFH
jgi:hypothetical protein